MKEIRFLILITITLIFLVGFTSADIIPENSHRLERCVKIVNLNEYPNIVLIGYYTGPGSNWAGQGENPYLIDESICLTKGYKFNTLHIYALNKSYFDSVGLNGLKMKNVSVSGECPGGCFTREFADENAIETNMTIEPYGGYVNNNNPLIKENIEYSIVISSNENLIFYISKRTSEYNDGTPIKVETFPKPDVHIVPQPIPEPEKKSLWGSISCFFNKIFGGSC